MPAKEQAGHRTNEIGHTRLDQGMCRCWLLLCAAGFAIGWLLRAIARDDIGADGLALWAMHEEGQGRVTSTLEQDVGASLEGDAAA